MAGLGGNKKRNNSSSSRVSRFSEVLGAAQENVQISGYPDTQKTEQPNTQESDIQTDKIPENTIPEDKTQKSGYPDVQPSAQPTTQPSKARQGKTQKPGYPNTRKPKQSTTQKSKEKQDATQVAEDAGTQISGYPDIQEPTQPDSTVIPDNSIKNKTDTDTIQVAGYPDTQKSKQSKKSTSKTVADKIQVSGYPDTQQSEQPEIQASKGKDEKTQIPGYPHTQKNKQLATQESEVAENYAEKIPKRENPDYTQTTFRIPKKLSRQINRALMDLADEGVEIDRSDLLEELAGAFIRLADEVGVVGALEKCKNLGTQISE
ncbi:hypothetical protein NIES4101_27000 (plasmid) [Calothrix sp. NIES-4101]|nr:hypothetical protein NIES4101_27000 [Calothrix sp. NIES-4101]